MTHSFPTRRSSDLDRDVENQFGRAIHGIEGAAEQFDRLAGAVEGQGAATDDDAFQAGKIGRSVGFLDHHGEDGVDHPESPDLMAARTAPADMAAASL